MLQYGSILSSEPRRCGAAPADMGPLTFLITDFRSYPGWYLQSFSNLARLLGDTALHLHTWQL